MVGGPMGFSGQGPQGWWCLENSPTPESTVGGMVMTVVVDVVVDVVVAWIDPRV